MAALFLYEYEEIHWLVAKCNMSGWWILEDVERSMADALYDVSWRVQIETALYQMDTMRFPVAHHRANRDRVKILRASVDDVKTRCRELLVEIDRRRTNSLAEKAESV